MSKLFREHSGENEKKVRNKTPKERGTKKEGEDRTFIPLRRSIPFASLKIF